MEPLNCLKISLVIVVLAHNSVSVPANQKASPLSSSVYLKQRLNYYWTQVTESSTTYELYLKTTAQSLFLSRSFRSIYYGKQKNSLPEYLKSADLLPPVRFLNPQELDFDKLISTSYHLAEYLDPGKVVSIPDELKLPLFGWQESLKNFTYLQAMQSIEQDFAGFRKVVAKSRIQTLFVVTILPQWEAIPKDALEITNCTQPTIEFNPYHRFSPSHLTLIGLLSVFVICFIISIPFAVRYHYKKNQVTKSNDQDGIQLLSKGQRIWLASGKRFERKRVKRYKSSSGPETLGQSSGSSKSFKTENHH